MRGGEIMNSQNYYIGNCPICREYGMLEILYNYKKTFVQLCAKNV